MASQIVLLSHPRTACNMLERMLSKQPHVEYLSHPFAPARPMQIPLLDQLVESTGAHPDTASAINHVWRQGVAKWETTLKEAQKAKQVLFVHTHPHFALSPNVASDFLNEGPRYAPRAEDHGWGIGHGQDTTSIMVVPDELLLHPGTIPVFTIRHPGLMVPSCYRAMERLEGNASPSNLKAATNMGWSRWMYDWYVAHGFHPVIIDADDYMTSRDFMRKLCKKTGLDAERVMYSWPKATEKEVREIQPPIIAKVLHTLLGSEGIIPGLDAQNLNLEEEEEKWREEFGEKAALVKELVGVTMPHYEYLSVRRLRVDDERSTVTMP